LVGLLSPSDYAGYADEGRRLAVDVPNVTPMDAARFIAEATPIIGDAMAAKEIYDEATSENPNWAMVGALGGAAVLGLFPGIGDAAAKAVKSGARGLFDTSPAQEVSSLLASGRADEVTDEMLGKLTPNDNMELFELYQSGATGMDLPMDEASRMARAEAAGFEGNLFHGTGADIVGVDKSRLGEKQNLLGKGFYQTTSQSRPDRYIPKETDAQTKKRVFSEGGNVLPLMSKRASEFDLTKPTGADNSLNIGKVFEGEDFDVEYRGSGDQVFIKSKSDPEKSVYIDSYQDGLATVQKLKDTFGRNNVTSILEKAGFSGLRAAEGFGKATKVNYNPEDVRSRFARFDPRLSNLKNLSAGVALPGAGLLALQEMQKRANEEQQRQGLLQ